MFLASLTVFARTMNAPSGSAPTRFVSPPSFLRLSNKIAIFTGSLSGEVRVITTVYAAEGATLVCADLDPIAKAPAKDGDVQATHKAISERGGRSVFVKCDATESHNAQSLVESCVQQYRRPDT